MADAFDLLAGDDFVPAPKSLLSLSFSGDSEGTRTAGLSAALNLAENWRWLFSFSKAVDQNGEAEEFPEFFTGLAFSISPVWEVTGFVDSWGSKDSLWARGGGVTLSFLPEGWLASLTAVRRHVDLQLVNRVAQIYYTQFGGSLGYFALDPVYVVFSWEKYRFSEDITRLSGDLALRLVPADTLALSENFINWEAKLLTGFLWRDLWLDVTWSKSESAIDLKDARYLSLLLGWHIDSRWSVSLHGGRAKFESGEAIDLAGIGVSFSW